MTSQRRSGGHCRVIVHRTALPARAEVGAARAARAAALHIQYSQRGCRDSPLQVENEAPAYDKLALFHVLSECIVCFYCFISYYSFTASSMLNVLGPLGTADGLARPGAPRAARASRVRTTSSDESCVTRLCVTSASPARLRAEIGRPRASKPSSVALCWALA